MDARRQLRTACALSILAFLLLSGATALNFFSGGSAAQEQFEVFADPLQYATRLRESGQWLRVMLAVDNLFILAYVGALSFAALGFRFDRPAEAWAAGLGAFVLGTFDFWENLTMGTSLDMAVNGLTVDAGRIASQAAISGAKWNAAAAALVALTFAIPQERFFERVLVWAARIVFPIATALFVTGAAELRGYSQIALLAAMLSGFALLAIVTYSRSRDGFR